MLQRLQNDLFLIQTLSEVRYQRIPGSFESVFPNLRDRNVRVLLCRRIHKDAGDAKQQNPRGRLENLQRRAGIEEDTEPRRELAHIKSKRILRAV